MAGTTEGGKKAAETRKDRHPAGSPGSFEDAGRKGGKAADHVQAAKTRGHESLSEAGRRGGENSHRNR